MHYEKEKEDMIGDVGKNPFSSSSSSSPSSSQYKGVIPQRNGRWGAQVYDNHQRVWPGTLESDEEVPVRSYDRAAVELSRINNSDAGRRDVDAGGSSCVEREHMFHKVVTPSDVGKLNRLVIPKQHAEKYFPLDAAANEKGLLLNFEDLSGKPWRFRYSYWNSSQSYVMTKGWSRFVKEKKLDAGDIVSFERGVGELGKDRLYIDWRRRPDAPDPASFPLLPLRHPLSLPRSVPWSRVYLPTPTVSMPSPDLVHFQQLNYAHRHRHQTSYSGSTYGYHAVNPGSGSVFYLRSSAAQHAGVVQQGGGVPMVIDSVPVVHGKAATKRVRLFGVNLDCPISEEPECDILSSTIVPHTPMVSISSHSQLPPSLPSSQLRLYSSAPLPTAPDESPRRGNQSFFFNLDN